MPETVARILRRARDLPAAEWNACAGPGNPFLQHAFFVALEESESAVPATGWQPVHLVVDGADSKAAAILPAYLKSHSQGEYVFDHSWADAWRRAGGRYYPKLQSCVPFTPATGARLLLRDPALAPALLGAAEALTVQNGLSSAHATFIEPEQVAAFEAADWLVRVDQQFHWVNDGYASFDDFLADLSSRKRKQIRKERVMQPGIEIEMLTGDQITEAHWDDFWEFYQDTGARKWGQPYLTRDFFSRLGATMGDRVLLGLARRGSRAVAGALNLIGDDCLYGRYWGCREDVPFLHFELCYYRAIDWAIANGRARVEAGAQGSHKLARGYRPTPTYSAHFIPDPGFRRAVGNFLQAEREAVVEHIEALDEHGPFRKG
ncbi:GNAT family N-acetyltransferase [Glacieibacterium frigidum]|uniref:N-acetyltransferase n=1 Tax=Glacieibacterium frigidum TaxID=2593303 RepID=A0A552UFN9_9SPHN|nr:GNAT family N-acetyltransferase [Glacieibacterium frigidum]TRW17037.1 N-acetyltransferase [Glacieibacterium frigidum]